MFCLYMMSCRCQSYSSGYARRRAARGHLHQAHRAPPPAPLFARAARARISSPAASCIARSSARVRARRHHGKAASARALRARIFARIVARSRRALAHIARSRRVLAPRALICTTIAIALARGARRRAILHLRLPRFSAALALPRIAAPPTPRRAAIYRARRRAHARAAIARARIIAARISRRQQHIGAIIARARRAHLFAKYHHRACAGARKRVHIASIKRALLFPAYRALARARAPASASLRAHKQKHKTLFFMYSSAHISAHQNLLRRK